MKWLREHQLAAINQGWRLPVISYERQFKAHGNPLAVLGIVLFIFSVVGLLSQVDGEPLEHAPILRKFFLELSIPAKLWIGLAVATILVTLLSILKKNRSRKEKWPVVKAKILDKELRQVRPTGLNQSAHSKVWVWRLLRELDWNGVVVKVTPKPEWLSSGSESLAIASLDKALDEHGQIQLRINPEDPLETELATQGNLLFTR